MGYEIIDEIEAYDDIHGVFIHNNSDGGKYVKVGYHEGLVEPKIWLRVQDKKANNISFHTNRKAMNSWLVGIIRCKECNFSVIIDIQRKKSGLSYRYLVDSGWHTVSKCVARSYKIRLDDIEKQVFEAMTMRINELEIAHKQKETPDTETESIKTDILKLDAEIRSLMDRMAEADDVVFTYIQQRIKEIHAKKSELERKLQTKARKHRTIDVKPLTKPMAVWDTLLVQEKHDIAAEMIEAVYISHNSNDIEIVFSI